MGTRRYTRLVGFVLALSAGLGGCTIFGMENCRRMCPIGVKSWDGDKCECLTPKDLRTE